jgi:hypothetical protein
MTTIRAIPTLSRNCILQAGSSRIISSISASSDPAENRNVSRPNASIANHAQKQDDKKPQMKFRSSNGDSYQYPDRKPPLQRPWMSRQVSKPRTAVKSIPKVKQSNAIKERPSPLSDWIELQNIPPMMALEDILNSIHRVLEVEWQIGIRDIDTGETLNPSPPELWVRQAISVLSHLGRPSKWRIQLENRSVVNAVLEHVQQQPFYCVWKAVDVVEWKPPTTTTDVVPTFDDTFVRVENCPLNLAENGVRHLFRRYHLSQNHSSNVMLWKPQGEGKEGRSHLPDKCTFIVRFIDAANARAAVRELQGVIVLTHRLMIAQYPKQLVHTSSVGEAA